MNRPGNRSASRCHEAATVAASSFQMLTMLVPRTSVLVPASRFSTAARSPSGELPTHSVPKPAFSIVAARSGDSPCHTRQIPKSPR
jgi:hypothetical protein